MTLITSIKYQTMRKAIYFIAQIIHAFETESTQAQVFQMSGVQQSSLNLSFLLS